MSALEMEPQSVSPEWKKVVAGLRLIAISTTIMVLVVVVSVVALGMAAFSASAGPPTKGSITSIFLLVVFGLVLDLTAFVLGLAGGWLTLAARVSRGVCALGKVGMIGQTLCLLFGLRGLVSDLREGILFHFTSQPEPQQ